MTLISSNVKTNIIIKLNDILNIEDPEWSSLGTELKIKILHNLCSYFKNNQISCQNQEISQVPNIIENSINIPLKNQRPKKNN